MDAIREQKVYLEGSAHEVQVLTNYKNLIYFTTTKELNRRQVRQYETLSTFNFRILYVKGSENARADALSRKPEYLSNKTHESYTILRQDSNSLVLNQRQLAITGQEDTEKMWPGYANDPVVAEQRRQLGEGFAFTLGGTLLFQERIYVPTRDRIRFVKEFHGAMAHGH